MSILKSLHIIEKKQKQNTKINNDSILVYVLKYKSKLDNICPINECRYIKNVCISVSGM